MPSTNPGGDRGGGLLTHYSYITGRSQVQFWTNSHIKTTFWRCCVRSTYISRSVAEAWKLRLCIERVKRKLSVFFWLQYKDKASSQKDTDWPVKTNDSPAKHQQQQILRRFCPPIKPLGTTSPQVFLVICTAVIVSLRSFNLKLNLKLRDMTAVNVKAFKSQN